MENIYLCIIVFLFVLAVFDIWVGVSNDAVNFLNSALGAKVAKFRTIIIVAAVGVFCGAAMSNGMMDVARHGIFQPQYFSFREIMCILLAVMVTDVVLLDVFNSLGLPTSTTVSLVFELLGGTVALALFKYAAVDGAIGFAEMINTDKAFAVILAIFTSVAIALFFGIVVQWLARLIFTFNYKRNLKWFIGIFGGVAATAIVYFMLIKGVKDLSFMTPENKQWVADNSGQIVLYCLVGFTVLMQVLHWLKVNVFKVIVLLGTFALAMAFAGNDLVNFVGVPLAGYSAFLDFSANGAALGVDRFMMDSLNGPAETPIIFLLLSGAVMVVALVCSKKAHNVVKTSLGLSRQEEGEEMFGSSPLARSIVRSSRNLSQTVLRITPPKVKRWIDSRFNKDEAILADGASFDLVRASVNLVLAGLLIALGTSMKLPLSTTYVTFMVAMGSSLADRAWGRESAVFRITGVISVIGGWFVTAGAAFIACFAVAIVMYFGGIAAMVAMVALAAFILIRSGIRYRKKMNAERAETACSRMMNAKDSDEVWRLLQRHAAETAASEIKLSAEAHSAIVGKFIDEDRKGLQRTIDRIEAERKRFKKLRRCELLCLKRVEPSTAITHNTWFHVMNNNIAQLMYCLKRMYEPCIEHLDNNFNPLPAECADEIRPLHDRLSAVMERTADMVEKVDFTDVGTLVAEIDRLRFDILAATNLHAHRIQNDTSGGMVNIYVVYMNMLQESGQLGATLKQLLRAAERFLTA